MSMNNYVSVVIPAYNREKTIENAIRSVLNQTYPVYEVIVVDDCSIDNTEAVVKGIDDQRVRYHRLKQNSGACVARNTGVELSKGSYIAFQDSDDVWHPDKLEKQMQYLLDNEFDFISCGFDRIDENGTRALGRSEVPRDRVECWCKLINSNWVSTQTILCKKGCFDTIRFSPELKRFQDWDLALQAALHFKMGSLNESLVDVLAQADSITKTVKKGNPLLVLIEKHRSDVDFNNPFMSAVYYKCLGDAKRRTNPKAAARDYKKSLNNQFRVKVFLDYLMCITGIIRFYKTRT